MSLQEKSVKQFIAEMKAAGFDFEYKAVSNEGLTVKSKGWDARIYQLQNRKSIKNEKKIR